MQIEAVERNLIGLRETLSDPEIWGLPDAHVASVSQPSTGEEILDHVIEAGTQASDTLLVYYAGHGLTDTQDGELYLTLPNSRKFRFETAFRYEYLRRYLSSSKMKADKAVAILDCCFSGIAALGTMFATQEFADLAAVPGRCVLTASAPTKIAIAPPGETYTAFTGALLNLLNEGVPHGSDLLDMQTIYLQAHAELQARSRPLPQLGSQGSPSFICIAKNRSQHADASPPSNWPDRPKRTDPQRQSTGVPRRISALVREFLLEPPQPSDLSVVPRKDSENRAIRNARAIHFLEKDEDLIAVWEFEHPSFFGSKASSLIFTSRGIRVFRRRDLTIFRSEHRFFISYEEFHRYEFTYSTSIGRVGTTANASATVTLHDLRISGPNGLTYSGRDSDIKHMVNDLIYIKKIAVG